MALRSKKQRMDRPDDEGGGRDPEDARHDPEEHAAEGEGKVPSEEPEDDHARAHRERDEYREAWQRARADYQNLRRRLQTDIDSAVGRVKETMLLELLLVLDFMDMALAAPVESQEAKNLKTGVEMTRNQLFALLEREGVTKVPVEGAFDPSQHEAVGVVETDEVEPGAIVETQRPGYRIGGRTLRPAQVQVAGDPSAAQQPPRTAETDEDGGAAEAED